MHLRGGVIIVLPFGGALSSGGWGGKNLFPFPPGHDARILENKSIKKY